MKHTILKFERPGCIPCQTVGKLLDDNNIPRININQVLTPEMFEEYQIKSTPTILVLDRNNNEVERIVGTNADSIQNLKNYD